MLFSNLYATQRLKFPDCEIESQPRNLVSQNKSTSWVMQSGPVSQKIFTEYFDVFNTDEKDLIESVKIQRKKNDTETNVFIVLRKTVFDQIEFMMHLQNALGKQFIDLTYDTDSSEKLFHRIRLLLNKETDIVKTMALFHHDYLIPKKIFKKIIALKSLGLPNYYFKDDAITNQIRNKFDKKQIVNSDLKEIEGFIFKELEQFLVPLEYQSSCWNLINYFWPAIKGSEKLIYKLCQQITLQELPMFCQARLIMARILMMRKRTSITPIEHFYLEPTILLLEAKKDCDASNINDVGDQLDQYMNDFINNGRGDSNQESTINNISVTSKSIFRLLNIIRLKNIQIELLTQSLTKTNIT